MGGSSGWNVGSSVSELVESIVSSSRRQAELGETGEGWFLKYVSRGLGLVDILLELSVIRSGGLEWVVISLKSSMIGSGLRGSGSLDSSMVGDIGQGH